MMLQSQRLEFAIKEEYELDGEKECDQIVQMYRRCWVKKSMMKSRMSERGLSASQSDPVIGWDLKC